MKPRLRPIDILVVEDNPGDIRLTIEALKESQISNTLSIARDGVEALDFLFQRHAYAKAPRPDIILLDLNLPRKDGRAVLAEIKADPTLRRIPVIVLTTSYAEDDVVNAYDLHVNCYITKPVDMDRFIDVIKAIDSFWFTIVQLPSDVESCG